MTIIQRDLGNVTRLDLQGRIVLADGDELLKDRVNQLLSQGCVRLLLNMKEVTRMDTSGLSAMISLQIAVDRRGGSVKLLHLPARIYNLLVITRLTTLFEIFESESEAVASFSQPASTSSTTSGASSESSV